MVSGLVGEVPFCGHATIALGVALEHRVRGVLPAASVLEDPATGAAAAGYGAYLGHLGAIDPPFRLVLRQGETMACPSTYRVDGPPGDGGIRVSGGRFRYPGRTPHKR